MQIGNKFHPTWNNTKVYTAAGFFGATGVEYSTSQEAAIKNNMLNDSKICIKIKETGGACYVENAVLINHQN